MKPGQSLKSVARELVAANVLPAEWPLVALARWRGVDRTIKAGNYEIDEGVTLRRLLDKLTQGDVTQTSLTIVEGSTIGELRAQLAANPDIAKGVAALSDAELMAKIGAPGMSPEGWFFPDTYFFAAGSSELALLGRAHRLMRERLDAAWAKRAPDLPLKDPYEALILASIVEKETGHAADRPLIASVFVNRLKARDAAAGRSDGDLRDGRKLRRQPAQARSRGRHAVQHLHARRLAADADRAARGRRRSTRRRIRRRRSISTSSRAATARANSRRISPITIAPWQNSRRASR